MKILLKAIALARAEFKPIHKNKTAKIPTKSGSSYSYKYADYGDILEAIEPALNKHGLLIYHTTSFKDVYYLSTYVHHVESGEFMVTCKVIPNGLNAQEIGSFETYMKRYNTCGLLNIISEEDDDGAIASQKPIQQRPTYQQQKPRSFDSDGIML